MTSKAIPARMKGLNRAEICDQNFIEFVKEWDGPVRSAPAATGARYIGQGVEWATSAAETEETGTLSLLSPDQSTALSVVEQCVRPLASVGTAPVLAGGAPTPAPVADKIPACLAPQLKLASGEGDAGVAFVRRVGLAVVDEDDLQRPRVGVLRRRRDLLEAVGDDDELTRRRAALECPECRLASAL